MDEMSVDLRQSCFFCNAQLGVSTRNCFNIFKTIVFPIEKKASDLIADVLDIEVKEGSVHSEIICRKCFKLVNEFADLETRAAEIRTDLTNSFNSTRRILEEVSTELDNEGTEEEEGTPLTLDADRLSQLVAEGGANSLSELLFEAENGNVSKLLVVNDGEYEEVELAAVMGEQMDEEEEVDDEEANGDDELDTMDKSEVSEDASEVLETVGDTHYCRLCPVDAENRPFSCVTKDLRLMIVHLKTDHQVRVYLCDVCGAEFKRRSELNAHLEYHNASQEESEYQCETCNRVFDSLRLFRIHKRFHQAQNKTWTCEICSKKYSSRNLLEEHQNTHTGIRPYMCPSCGKSFSSKYTFKAHSKTHEARERNFRCHQCCKTFLSSQNLIQHAKTHSDVKDFVCQTCGKGFGSARNLEVHMVVHSGVKPFVCSTCGKAFARKAEIKDHERIHTGERPFQCEHCGAQFSQRSNLQSHKRVTHYDDRRYLCGDCGKGFKRRRLLDYHMKAVHTGERPYQCATCEATFVYPEHYKKHIRIHTGLKPYKCEVCEKAFNSRDNRNAHRFVHSDKKPYECLVCGVGFMRKPLLYNHMQLAGHINDTIVVNQPRLEKDDGSLISTDQEGDIELTIVEEDALRNKKKLYLTDLSEHVIIQGDEKTLLAKLSDGNLKALDDGKQLVDEDGNLVDMDDGIIEIKQFDDEMTMTAHVNEQGQLVSEDGQVITEDGQPLIVDEAMNEGGNIIIKTEQDPDSIQYVQIRVPESQSDSKSWLNMVQKDSIV